MESGLTNTPALIKTVEQRGFMSTSLAWATVFGKSDAELLTALEYQDPKLELLFESQQFSLQ